MNALDLLLTAAAASYSPPEPKAIAPKAPKAPKAEKVEGPKRGPGRPRKNPETKAEKPSTEEKPQATNPLAGIEVGSLSPAQFLTALHQAGKADPNQENWDIKKAIHGFCGYTLSEPQGTQLDNAVRSAKTKINGVIADKPKPAITVAGYVAGIPNETQKRVDDLRARIDAEVETYQLKRELCQDRSLSIEVRKAHACEAGLANARILSMKAQLRSLGYLLRVAVYLSLN